MKYFALLTTYGEKVLAEATALGTKIELTHMAVGDGGGTLPAPDTKQTKLVNEKRRAAINTLFIDSVNTNQVIAEQVIPENEGGWWIREIGLFDKSGLLVAVANCPETYKPLLAEGSGRTQTIRMILIVSHTEAVTLKVDPAIVLATRGYVDDSVKTAIETHVKSRNHPDATTSAKGFVQLADTLSEDNSKAVTPKLATEINQRALNAQTSANAANTAATNANNNANGRVPSTRKVNNKPLSTDITLSAGDVNAYTKTETDTKVADAKKAGTDANTNANGRVPNTRKVNNKPLSADITLSAGDVGAYTKAETDTKVADANTNANGRVPNTRKVNNKPLSADITLSAGDVGAYTKAETDTKVADAKKAGTDAQATANAANTAATNANNNANGRVPSGRKVNNKALTADIVLNAGDVGAYTKAEVDTKINTGFGYTQKWKDVSVDRKSGVTYTNSTGNTIAIAVMQTENSQNPGVTFFVDGLELFSTVRSSGAAVQGAMCIVPRGSTYKFVTTVNAKARVMEMRQ
ncbi:phage tail protein [Providencia sp. PROV110]|uniref:phage tail protein n=1 Tax=Providencia sp. PROV110 TaxID=2949821 RepID=UPI00234B7985|nr:phage tail protein [Providencia sp. PROV110]